MKPGFPDAGEISRSAIQSGGAAAEFDRRWRTGKPLLEDFLAGWTPTGRVSPLSAREIGELVSIDQRERWRRGERPPAEDYLARFPHLTADDELVLDVIYNEFLIREELGEVPSPFEYRQRFPRYADPLRDQIEFHLALGVEGARPIAYQDTHQRTPFAAQLTTVPGARLPAHLTNFVPGYEILSELGRGGMGIVYQARQLSLNRLVALKMLRAGDCGSPALLARFKAEAEAVARLHHPQIVQIYDYGEHDGLPYLALELVEGGSLAAKIQGTPWPAREAAELVVTLSRGVHFAHEQGIVHRDLKPANVLVRAHDQSRTAGPLVAKITDFGLAKVFRESAAPNTQTGAILGTPSYMAPEQARGQSHLIGPAADVYALGAILYELLTGQPPFMAASAMETLNQLLTAEPVSPALLAPRLPPDLITIVTKCLQKEPQQRYASAAELADDLDRFLGDRPIQARRTSIAERGWRWCRRNPVLSSLAGSVAMLLVIVAAVSFTYSVQLTSQLSKTQQAERGESTSRRMAEIRLWDAYLAEINAGNGSQWIGQRAESLATVDRANELLDSIGRTPERVLQLRNATIATLARPDLRKVRTVATSRGNVNVDFSVASDRYVTGTLGALNVYRLSNGQHLHSIAIGNSYGIAAISGDGRFVSATTDDGATVWQCDGARPVQAWNGQGENFVTFSPDSRQAAVSDASGGMHLVDLPSGQAVRQLGKGSAQSQFSFHAPSRRIAVCTPTSLQIIDWDTGQVLTELLSDAAVSHGAGVAWHPSGELVAVGGLNDGVELWNVAANRRHMTFPHRGPIKAPRFSRSGNLLLTFNPWTTCLRVWNVGTGQEVLRAPTFGSFALDASASDGDHLIRIDTDSVALCRLEPGLAANPFCQPTDATLGEVQAVAVSPDGRLLAIGRSHGFELWDLVTQRRASHTGSPFCGPKFDCRGDLFIACQWGLYQWPRQEIAAPANAAPTSTTSRFGTQRFGPPKKHSGSLVENAIAISDDGKVIAVKALSGWQVIRPQASSPVVKLAVDKDPRWVSVSPDGRSVALSNWDKSGTILCDSATGERIVELPTGHTGQPHFSPDGNWLATSPDGVCLCGASATGHRRLCSTLEGRPPAAWEFRFHPTAECWRSGNRTASPDWSIRPRAPIGQNGSAPICRTAPTWRSRPIRRD